MLETAAESLSRAVTEEDAPLRTPGADNAVDGMNTAG